MRQIGTLPSEELARRFGDYVLTLGVHTRVEEERDGWVVWVYEEDQVEQAQRELAEFTEDPHDPVYQQATRTAARLRRETEKKREQARKRHVDAREHWNRPLHARCPVTFTLMVISIFVTVTSRLGEDHEPIVNSLTIASYEREGRFIRWQGLQDIRDGQVWRLVTPIFIHLHILHILFNMYMLYFLGTPVESGRGSRRYLLLVLLIAILSNLAQYWWAGPSFGGMSGVVYGIFGYIWMKSRYDPQSGFFMPPMLVVWLIGFFLLGVLEFIPRVANMAHGVGLAVGMIAGYTPKLWRDLQRLSR